MSHEHRVVRLFAPDPWTQLYPAETPSESLQQSEEALILSVTDGNNNLVCSVYAVSQPQETLSAITPSGSLAGMELAGSLKPSPSIRTHLEILLSRLSSRLKVVNTPKVVLGKINERSAAFSFIETSLADSSQKPIEVDMMLTLVKAEKGVHPSSEAYLIWMTARVPLSNSERNTLLGMIRAFRVESPGASLP